MNRVVAARFLIAALFVATNLGAQSSNSGSTATACFRFGGFGNIVFSHLERRGREAFETGELDLYAIWQFSDDWSVLGEGFIQHAGRSEDIDLQPTKRVEVELERLHLTYNPSDRFRLEIGEIHTGIIRWNEREHRGRFLQTPIAVPSIANRQEQGGAWPLRFAGVWSSGRLPGSLGVRYGAGIGETRGETRDEIEPLFDRKTNPAGLLSLSVSPEAFSGLDVGGAAYVGDIPAPDGKMRESDATLFASLVRGGIEARSEWAEMRHRRVGSGQQFLTHGWYSLLSWRPRGQWKSVRPYLLLDHLSVARDETYLTGVFDQSAWAAGVRWDARPWLAIKSDYGGQLAPDHHHERLARVALAFSF